MSFDKIVELQQAHGAKAKQSVLEKYKDDRWFTSFLYYALNPLLVYRVSEKTLALEEDETYSESPVVFDDIFHCCDSLSRLRGIDDATIRQVKAFLYGQCDEEERPLYIKLLAKTLRLGVTAKTVNKAIPNLIPEWEIQQAYSVEKYPLAEGEFFWLTQKLNGVRATFYNGQLIARSGVPYEGLDHIIDEISWTNRAGFVLDGELTLKDKGNMSDNEAFRTATGILNSDEVNKTAICYTIFDAIPVKDFESATPAVPYSVRRDFLENLNTVLKSREHSAPAEYSSILPVLYSGSDQSKITELLDQMVAEDKEGLMVNTDVPYKRTRHKGILKVKRFYTMDLPIIGYDRGSNRLEGTLGALVLDYKDNEVKVGSGFTDEQRAEFWRDRESLIGKLCEVKYKEISNDKNTGKESLQFPVFVRIRDDKTEVSYG